MSAWSKRNRTNTVWTPIEPGIDEVGAVHVARFIEELRQQIYTAHPLNISIQVSLRK